RGVERVDALELEQRAATQLARLVEFAAAQQGLEDVEGGRPDGGADAGPRVRERLGDVETEADIVGNPRHDGAFAGQVDPHGRDSLLRKRRPGKAPKRPITAFSKAGPPRRRGGPTAADFGVPNGIRK